MSNLDWKMKAKSPCLNCPDRTIGCHSTCEKYIEFQKVHAEEKAKAFEARREEAEYWSMRNQSKHRAIQVKKDYGRFKKS